MFISYARSDCSAFAEELVAGLDVAGFEPFLDRHDIAAGEDWEARLGGLIQAADTVVFVISPAAIASERCAWEVQKAEALSKRIIPAVAINVPEAHTPHDLKRRHYIFFTEDHSFARALRELAQALRTDLDWIREHTRLGELAARWLERDKSDALLLRGSELQAARAWLASWQAPAPQPTESHRAFIGEGEAAEVDRHSAERKRLEEVSSAQSEKERALKRFRRVSIGAAAVIAIFFVGTAIGGVNLLLANERLAQSEAQRADSEAELARRQAELGTYERELAGVTQRLAAVAAELADVRSLSARDAARLRDLNSRLTVTVREGPGGELAFAPGAGFDLFDVSVTERDLSGRGDQLRERASDTGARPQQDIEFREPTLQGDQVSGSAASQPEQNETGEN